MYKNSLTGPLHEQLLACAFSADQSESRLKFDNFMLMLQRAWQITSETWARAFREHVLTIICYN